VSRGIIVASLCLLAGCCWIVVDRCESLWLVVDRCGSLWLVPCFTYVNRGRFCIFLMFSN
jgi:hypothetical protein